MERLERNGTQKKWNKTERIAAKFELNGTFGTIGTSGIFGTNQKLKAKKCPESSTEQFLP